MIELFACQSPNVLKVVIALEELGLPYNTTLIDIISGKGREPEFLAINPNGRVPAIVDSDGPGGEPLALAESGAILVYLAEKHGRFLPQDARKRAATMQWLMFQMSGTGPMLGQYIYFSRRVKDQSHSLDRYTSEVLRLYEVVERRLGESRYLACDEYTIADIAVFPGFRMVDIEGNDRSRYPNMNRWIADIGARPAVARAMAAIEHMSAYGAEGVANFTDDQWDRLFGRGKYSRAAALQQAKGAVG